MASISLGKIAFSWKGIYSSVATYAKQDVVSLNGTTYVCLQDGALNQTPALLTAYWQQFSQGVGTITSNPGEIVYNNGAGLVSLPIGQANQVLTVNSSGLPIWSTPDVRSGSKVLKSPENSYRDQAQCYRHFGAIMTDLSVRMWGFNSNYTLGDGTTNARSYPGRVGFGADFPGAKKLYLTYNTTQYCIDINDKLWTWGYNGHGQIGDNTTTARPTPYFASNDPLNSIFGKSVALIALASGVQDATSSMALCTDGTVHMCGYNGSGQLGQGNTTNLSKFTLVQNLAAAPIVKIAAGRESAMACYAINSNGQLYSWGYNGDGQLGDGSTANATIPVLRSAGALANKFVYDIVGGYQSAFAVCRSTTPTTTGAYASGGVLGSRTITLAAIGSIEVGHIVTGNGIPGLSITQGPVTVTAISGNTITLSANLTAQASNTYNFFVSGMLVGWGVNTTYGNLGDGTFANQFTPVQIFASGIAEAFNGNYDYPVACVKKTNNTWWVAGAGAYGANLDTAASNRSSWVQITHASITPTNYIKKVVKSGTGSYNWMAALLVDGTVLTWGYNGNGALAIGNTTNQVGVINKALINKTSRKVIDLFAFNQSSEQTLGMLMDDGGLYLTGYGGSYCNTDDRAQSSYVPFPVIM